MLVSKWGNSLAVRLPKEVVEKLGLKEGDNLLAEGVTNHGLTLRKDDEKQRRREEALKRLAAHPGWPLPEGYRFDRAEIYDRSGGFSEEERQDLRDDKP